MIRGALKKFFCSLIRYFIPENHICFATADFVDQFSSISTRMAALHKKVR